MYIYSLIWKVEKEIKKGPLDKSMDIILTRNTGHDGMIRSLDGRLL
jgi:hypothetical protein